jgi:hypothetical protein
VFNLKLSGIVAGVAFILSLLIGLLSRTMPPALIIRPLIFALLFFIIANLINLLVNRFLPELLETNTVEKAADIVMPGSQIDIVEESSAVPGSIYARPDDSEENVGDISSLVYSPSGSRSSEDPAAAGSTATFNFGGMDQSGLDGYTEEGIPTAASENGGSFDMLADLESLAGAFVSSSEEKEEGTEENQGFEEDPLAPARAPVGNKPPKMEGDFNPKDMAQGIRTILKKEEG